MARVPGGHEIEDRPCRRVRADDGPGDHLAPVDELANGTCASLQYGLKRGALVLGQGVAVPQLGEGRPVAQEVGVIVVLLDVGVGMAAQ